MSTRESGTEASAAQAGPRRRLRVRLLPERWLRPWREAGRFPRVVVWVGAAITLTFVFVAFFAPYIWKYGGESFEGIPKLAPPSLDHPFGTTSIRFDVLARVLFGARLALEVVLLSVAISIAVGLPLGLFAGYRGGWLDRALVMIMDSLYAFPGLLLAIVVAAFLGRGVVNASVAISVVYIPQYFRVIRNHVISVREEVFVDAARALGAKPGTIVWRYIFFNVVQSIPVIFSLNAADAILTLAALGFLGYGVNPPTPEWGQDLSRAIHDLASGVWWTALFPGLAIVFLTTGLTLVGEGLNDIVNPLLRRVGVTGPTAIGAVAPAGAIAGSEAHVMEVEP
jgi:peptide/nickel transport system permease protein